MRQDAPGLNDRLSEYAEEVYTTLFRMVREHADPDATDEQICRKLKVLYIGTFHGHLREQNGEFDQD